MNVDEQLSAILKERAPDVAPNPHAWDRITAQPDNRSRWHASAAAAAVVAIGLGAVAITRPSDDRGGRQPATSPSPPAVTTASPPVAGGFAGRVVYAHKGVIRVNTFRGGADPSRTSGDVALAPPGASIDYVDVTADGTVVFASGIDTCASGIYSVRLGPAAAGSAQPAPIDPSEVETLVAPRAGVALRMPTIHDGRLAFTRAACSNPAEDVIEYHDEQLIVRDLASGSDRVVGSASGSGDRMSWAAGRYLVFTSHGMPSGLVAYDTTSKRAPLTARATGGCYWGPPAAQLQDAEVAAVEVCDDGKRSVISTFAVTRDEIERGAKLAEVDGEITRLDYDATGTRLLYDVDGRLSVLGPDGTSTRLKLSSAADWPVW